MWPESEVISVRCGEGGAHRILKAATGEKSSLLCMPQMGPNVVTVYLWPLSITAKVHRLKICE